MKIDKRDKLKSIYIPYMIAICILIYTYFVFHKIYTDDVDNAKQEAIQLIQEGEYDKASITLVSYSKHDSDAKVLYNYASAKKKEAVGDISLANYYLNGETTLPSKSKSNADLVSSYDGPLKEDIKNYAKKLAAKKVEAIRKQEEERERYEATRNKRGVHIGMTSDEVLKSNWGEPQRINRHRSVYGYTEQWVYRNSNYLYFKEDEWGLLILTDIQN